MAVRDILLRFREIGLDEIKDKYRQIRDEISKAISGTAKSIGQLPNRLASGVSRVYNRLKSISLSKLAASMQGLVKTTDEWAEGMKRVDLSFLSLLFSGYAMHQMAVSLYKTFSTTWLNIVSDLNESKKQLLAVNANFEYMKFVIFDIFTQSEVFKKMTEFLANAAEAIADFASQHPKIVEMVGTFIAFIGIVGALFIGLGLVMQTIYGVKSAVAVLSQAFVRLGALVTGGAAGTGGILGSIALGFVLIGALAVVAIATSKEAAKNISKDMDTMADGITKMFEGIMSGDVPKFLDGLKRLAIGLIDFVFQAVGGTLELVFKLIHSASKAVADWLDKMYRVFSNLPAPVKGMLGIGGVALAGLRTAARAMETSFNPRGMEEALKSVHDLLYNKIGKIGESPVPTMEKEVGAKRQVVSITEEQISKERELNEILKKRLDIYFDMINKAGLSREAVEREMSRLGYRLAPEL